MKDWILHAQMRHANPPTPHALWVLLHSHWSNPLHHKQRWVPSCRKCGAGVGEQCITKGGNPSQPVHADRRHRARAYWQSKGIEPERHWTDYELDHQRRIAAQRQGAVPAPEPEEEPVYVRLYRGEVPYLSQGRLSGGSAAEIIGLCVLNPLLSAHYWIVTNSDEQAELAIKGLKDLGINAVRLKMAEKFVTNWVQP